MVVRKVDRENLSCFSPDNNKYTFTVMPFGSRNPSIEILCKLDMRGFNILRDQFLLLTITTQPAYCPEFGDSIAAHKLIMTGQLTNEILLPDVHIIPSDIIHDTSYEHHIDHSYNTVPHVRVCTCSQASGCPW